MSSQNLALVFKEIPEGEPKPGKDLVVEDIGAVDTNPPEGGIVIQQLFASFDPYLRGLLRSSEKKSYFPAFEQGKPILNDTINKVVKSSNPDFQPGDLVRGRRPIQQYAVVSKDEASKLTKLDTTDGPEDLRQYLGALGMPGLTAYSSIYEIGKPKKGEVIFISSAAGAVGQIVGQLAKHDGLYVIGSVGSDEKLSYLTDELGFDAGFNYKKESPSDALKRLAPEGIDIYYENVGGEHLDAAIEAAKTNARIVMCGMISEYNVKDPKDRYGHKNLMLVVGKQLTMRGFLVAHPDFGPAYTQEHQRNVRKWLKDGSFTAKIHEWEMKDADKGFVGMLRGENFGKAVLKVT